MSNLINNIQNNALATLAGGASNGVLNAIKTASAKTGVNFAYMVQQASAESSFKPDAKAKTSSASGLYQFIESTWISMVDKYGDKHGIETDGKNRGEILELRNDPRAASLMAAELASENQNFLQNRTKGEVGSTELYFAHFLGAGQASEFLNARTENPMQQAALLFPNAAKANRNVFYDQASGRAKSLDEVYAYFDKKFSIEDVKNSAVRMAGVQAAMPNAAAVSSTMLASNASSATATDNVAAANTAAALLAPPPLESHYVKLNAREQRSYNSMGGYQNLFANPLAIMMLTQMDLPDTGDSNNSGTWFLRNNRR